jgi:hypothetical protein
MWLNQTDGDCVTAEEAFAKATSGILISDTTVQTWATINGVLNGADLDQVLQLMQTAGFSQDGDTLNDGPPTSVDWQPTVQFSSSTNTYLSSPATWAVSLSSPFTVVWVGHSNYVDSAEFFFDDWTTLEGASSIAENGGGGSYDLYYSYVTGKGGMLATNVSDPSFVTRYIGVPHIFTSNYSSEPITAYLDGVPAPGAGDSTGGAGDATTLTGLTLGAYAIHNGGSDGLNGTIAEFAIYSSNLTQHQVGQLHHYLGTRYNITVIP